MNLLAGTLYDPGTAVNKVTTAVLAMTALDTTNLRHTVTVPPSGRIKWKVEGTLHGATTMPQIMLGVMEGATVRGRAAPMHGATNIAATSLVKVSAEGIITGLTPGASIVLDAAYGVETLVAATGLKYGGPNNTTANDNFGGLLFELYDPSPIYTPSSTPSTSVHQKLDVIDDFVDTEIGNIQGRLPAALVGGRIDSSVGAMAAGVITAAAHAAGAIDANALAADAGAELADAVWDELTVGHAGLGSTGLALTTASLNVPLDAAGTRAALGMALANLDLQLLAIDDYIDTEVSAIKAKTDNLPTSPASETTLAAVKAKTDSLSFTVAGKLDVNVLVVNGITVGGAGTQASPWGPA